MIAFVINAPGAQHYSAVAEMYDVYHKVKKNFICAVRRLSLVMSFMEQGITV